MRYLQNVTKEAHVKLDVKDRRILAELEKNSRQAHTHIAKVTQLSRDTVEYRIKRLEYAGVIQGYRTVTDIKLFGYDAYHIFLQLNKPTQEIEKEIISKFQKYQFMRAILKFSGKYDFELAVIAKDIVEFDNILDKIISDCQTYLKSYEVLIISKPYISRVFPKKFLKGILVETEKNIAANKTSPASKNKKASSSREVDKLDIDILKNLSENPLIQSFPLAKKLKVSHDAITYRVRKLIDNGTIKKFIPVINYSSINYSIYCVLLNIGNSRRSHAMLKELLSEDPNILWAVKCVGKYDLIIYLCISDTQELHSTVNTLRSYFPQSIQEYEIMLGYEEYKYTYFPDYVYI